MTAAAIEIDHLSKRYNDFKAIDDLSLEVAQGEFFGFLGPNGAGKTTTINAIVGLAEFEGRIRVMGHDVVTDYRSARRQIGLSPQEFNFDRYLSIREVLLYTAGYFGIPPKDAEKRADHLLDRFGLGSKRHLDFTKLSGGMKRRLSLARALIYDPKILILDEPTAGVDVELRLELWNDLRELNAQGITIFLTTHYLEEAQALCRRIGIIDHGRMIALETTDNLVRRLSGERIVVTIANPFQRLPKQLDGLNPTWKPDDPIIEFAGGNPEALYRVMVAVHAAGLGIVDLQLRRKTLQDIFLELTGRRNST